jgi:hypothetical protein
MQRTGRKSYHEIMLIKALKVKPQANMGAALLLDNFVNICDNIGAFY